MREDRLIDWLRAEIARRGVDLLGDDAAFLERDAWAVSVDQQIEGTHFSPGTDAAVVARRLLAVNLSDLAAVGALPAYALLTLAVPTDFALKRFYRAFLAAARRHRVELAGGDIARASRPAFSLTIFGRRIGAWVRRDAARPSDILWLAGSVGESAAGRRLLDLGARLGGRRVELPRRFSSPSSLAAASRRAVRRHLEPRAQLALGAWLARRRRAAAIDISDGLLLDLDRLCRASGVGARLDLERLGGRAAFAALARKLNDDPLALALHGGEDYALLCALPPAVRPPADLGCRRIGDLTSDRSLRALADGRRLEPRGWDHLAPLASR